MLRKLIRRLGLLILAGAVASCATSRIDNDRITAGNPPWAVDFQHDPSKLSVYLQGPAGRPFPESWTARAGTNTDGTTFVLLEAAK